MEKFLLWGSLIFYPLSLYRWRIFSLPSFSLYEVFLLSSLFVFFIKSQDFKIPKSLLFYFFVYIVEIFNSVIRFGQIPSQGLNSLNVTLLSFISFLAFYNTFIPSDDYDRYFIFASFASLWLFYGTIIHLSEYFSGERLTSVPFGEFLKIASPKDETSLYYIEEVSTSLFLNLIRRFCFPISFSASESGIVAAGITILTFYSIINSQVLQINSALKGIFYFLLIIDVFYTFSTLSRTAVITLLTGILIPFVLKGKVIKEISGYTSTVFLKIVVVMMIIAVALIVLNMIVVLKFGYSFFDLFFFRFQNSEDSTTEHFETRLYALELFVRNPILGVGLGGYKYYRTIDKNEFFSGQHPHSNYFLVLAEGGVIVFFSYLYLFVFPMLKILLGIKKSYFSEKQSHLLIMLLSLQFAFCVAQLFLSI